MISVPSILMLWCPELIVDVNIEPDQKWTSQSFFVLLFTVNDQKAQVGEGRVYFSLGDGILALRSRALPSLAHSSAQRTQESDKLMIRQRDDS